MGDTGVCPGEPRRGMMSGLGTQGLGEEARRDGRRCYWGKRDRSCSLAAWVPAQGAVSGAHACRGLSGVFQAGLVPSRLFHPSLLGARSLSVALGWRLQVPAR